MFYVPSEDRSLVNAGSGAHPNLVHAAEESTYDWFKSESVALYRHAWQVYSDAIYDEDSQDPIATEVARNVLPVSIYTSAYLTGNLLGWFNFLRLRNGSEGHPQFEIVEVAKKVEAIIEELYPITYKAWKRANAA